MIKSNSSDYRYTIYDIILFLLFAHQKPIKGKTRQMKEIFLSLRQIFQYDAPIIPFIKHKFGPFSEEVEYALDNLISSDYISASGKKNSNEYGIEITERGKERIRSKFYELPLQTQQKLKEKRLEWDTHITSGILNLVYTRYEEYLENAVLKKRYKKLDWTDDNQKPDKK